mmetsp:Transcript_7800/g.18584  ORF Transcript_7800/g.18584 Transcript_7800/m.18584 type:complete len:298 (+) Transcript_7800:71-964(+)
MVDDESNFLKQGRQVTRENWKTKRGFVYPAPKKPSEFYVHPHKPTEARIEILKEEWIENELHPKPVEREMTLKDGQPDFNCLPASGKMVFGGLEPPRFERPYDNNNLGSSTRLPRGSMYLDKDPEFFRSVHLCGEGLAKEKEDNKKREEELWQSKVVVDDLDFKVGGFNVRDRPVQLEKASDILQGKAQKISIKMVRNARLPSGKKVPLRQPPYSMFTRAEYSDPRDFTEDLRADDPTTYTAKDLTGQPLNFKTHIHRSLGKPKSQIIESHTRIKPMSEAEKVGERWMRSGSSREGL